MTLREVFEMVSAYWANVAKDEAFTRKPIYDAIVDRQSKKSLKFLEGELSPSSFEFAKARIQEIHGKKKGRS